MYEIEPGDIVKWVHGSMAKDFLEIVEEIRGDEFRIKDAVGWYRMDQVSLVGKCVDSSQAKTQPAVLTKREQFAAMAMQGLFHDIQKTPRIRGLRRYRFAVPTLSSRNWRRNDARTDLGSTDSTGPL